MRFGQTPNTDNQSLLQQILDGQQRLAFVEKQIKMSKILMVFLTLLTVITLVLNRKCTKKKKK